ncbi:hypothetical protein [Zavarzinia compransoris]|uniref:DUF2157 domain-containing protein n=1 Tax=Zavarzinia compransoris TaxID=1264899 RepID=A0A317E2R8_9PROT|nr:hypothetical protein [Zavarzinia compransoris]PWR20460.1 hypothetical protein DKG75_10650 [Zavarzinia compransoris]TDP43897.1 hypothetical protein DES42_109153 [Zavarzinia compransoris]
MDRLVKVTLDLDALVAGGQLTLEEAERLARLGKQSTGMLAFNLLVGFGVIAVATGVLALVPETGAAIAIGLVLALVGIGIGAFAGDDWGLLGQMCIVVGALIGGGGVLTVGDFTAWAFVLVAAAYAAGAALSRNGLLAGLAVIAVSGAVGAETGYIGEDGYAAAVPDSTLAIVVMLVLTAALAGGARLVGGEAARLFRLGAGTALVVANFGFWVGSLWGDRIQLGDGRVLEVPDYLFALAWAALLIAAGVGAARRGARWTLNCAAVFGAVHLFSQWFDRLEATPESVLAAGIVALGLALALTFLNKRLPQ